MTEPKHLAAALQKILPQARLKKTSLNISVPLQLWLIDPTGWDIGLSQEEAEAAFDSPPYWCFCWGSGLALADWIGRNRELFRDKTLLDLGSGSGVVAIAACLAGAVRVIACDNDPLSRLAIAENASLNGVRLEVISDLSSHQGKEDFLVAADVLYDPDNLALTGFFQKYARQVFIADSRVRNFDKPGFELVETFTAVTKPDLGENEDVKQVRLYFSRGVDAAISLI